jgi:hypothetical protein
MTTSIFQASSGTLISDRRWSLPITLSDQKEYMIICDKTDFAKIAYHDEYALLFAGDGILISLWKKWLLSGMKDPRPPLSRVGDDKGISIISIDFLCNPPCVEDFGIPAIYYPYNDNAEIIAIGSGGIHAIDAMQKRNCLISAISFASTKDYLTSSSYDTIRFQGASTSTPQNDHYDHHEILERMKGGMIMEISQKSAMCISNHNMKEEILNALSNTNASAQSGSGHLWTEEQTKRLDQSINDAKLRRANRDKKNLL